MNDSFEKTFTREHKELPQIENLKVFSNSKKLFELLSRLGMVQKGHFEYKGVTPEGKHLQGEYFFNIRKIPYSETFTALPKYYEQALLEFFPHQEIRKRLLFASVANGTNLFAPTLVAGMRARQKHHVADFPADLKEVSFECIGTEKRKGQIMLPEEYLSTCPGRWLVFIEDVCNNGTSAGELIDLAEQLRKEHGLAGYSILYLIHRGHKSVLKPKDNVFALSKVYAPSYPPDKIPLELQSVPLKPYSK